MSAGELGQVATVIGAVLLGWWLYRAGFFSGFRRGHQAGREATAETLNVLSRVEDGASDRPEAVPAYQPYRSPKTPLSFPIVYDGRDHGDH